MNSIASKIFARKVLKIGHESSHSLAVTIPAKICKALQIEKGTTLYFKLDGNNVMVSKEKLLGIISNSTESESKKEEDVRMREISLSDLHY
jgi:antitoxin component of MazEF toxin-antitoxin module